MADAGGRPSGKHCSSSSARGRRKEREGRGRGGRRNHEDGDEEEQHKATSGKASGGKVDSAKGKRVKCKRCGEIDTKPSAVLIRSAASVVVKAIRRRPAPTTSSLFSAREHQGL